MAKNYPNIQYRPAVRQEASSAGKDIPNVSTITTRIKASQREFEWDAFVCHASEDKDKFVRQLVKELGSRGLKIWYDEFTLKVGDSLRQSIEKGLAKSRYGIVVLSPNFYAKKWPQDETNGLAAKKPNGENVILPIWLDVDEKYIVEYSPMLADLVAAKASDGMAKVVSDLLNAMNY
jgi:predicted nucleotide-binding protein